MMGDKKVTKGRESIEAEKPHVCLVISPLLENRGLGKTAAPVGRLLPSVSVLTPHLGSVEGEWHHHLSGKGHAAGSQSGPPADLEPSLS